MLLQFLFEAAVYLSFVLTKIFVDFVSTGQLPW